MKMHTQQPKTYEKNSEGSPERKVHSNTSLHNEDMKNLK